MDEAAKFGAAAVQSHARTMGLAVLLTLAGITVLALAAFAPVFGALVVLPVIGLGAIVALAVALAAPVYLLYLVPVLMVIEYRIRIGPVSFTLAETAFVLVWVVVAIHSMDRKLGLRRVFWVERKWIVLLCLVALPGVFLEGDLKHALSTYRDLIIPLLFLWGFIAARLRRTEVTALAKVFVLLAVATAALGIAQYFSGRFMWLQSVENQEWQEFKLGLIQASPIGTWLRVENWLPVGLYQQTNDFGNFLMLPLCVALAWAVAPGQSRRVRFFWSTACAILFVALALCFFRSGVLTIVAAVVFWLAFRKRRLSIRALCWVTLAAAIFLGIILYSGLLDFDQFGTVFGRFDMLTAAISLLWEHPLALLTGGFSSAYHLAYDQVQMVHNLALYGLIRFGLPATVALYVIYSRILGRLKAGVDLASRENRDFQLLLFAGLALVILLYGQTATVIDNIQNTMWLSFWFGVGYYHCESRQERDGLDGVS